MPLYFLAEIKLCRSDHVCHIINALGFAMPNIITFGRILAVLIFLFDTDRRRQYANAITLSLVLMLYNVVVLILMYTFVLL